MTMLLMFDSICNKKAGEKFKENFFLYVHFKQSLINVAQMVVFLFPFFLYAVFLILFATTILNNHL